MSARQILLSHSAATVAKVLKTRVPAGSVYPDNWVYIRKNFAPVSEVWVSFQMAFDATTLNTFLTNGGCGSGDLVALNYSAGDGMIMYLFVEHVSTHYWYLGDQGVEVDSPVPTDSVWHLFEMHFITGGTLTFYIDGSSIGTITDDIDDTVQGLMIGQPNTCNDPTDDIVYHKNVTIGTTRGATDIFSDDFSSGDLSNWDVVQGDCSVIDDPF